jgi:hypothetical protein
MIRLLIALVALGSVQPPPRYPFDAAGRAARIERAWELRSDGDAFSVFTSLARCGRDIFLSDNQNNIFRIDAEQPSSTPARLAGDAEGIGRPTAVAADCATRRLHVINSGPRNIATIDIVSGKVLGARPYRRELFTPYSLVVVAPGILQTGGTWVPDYDLRPLVERQPERQYERSVIGERVHLESGAVSPGLAPYEIGCLGANACTTAAVDAIGDGAAGGWIASQATSTRVALYDAAGTRTGFIDVRSPKFVRDGSVLPTRNTIAVIERWRARNSVIRRVFAAGGRLTVAHSRTVIGPAWVEGEEPQLEVWMNIYEAGGAPLVSDVRLPDLPIGRDATHLYAIDYGAAGRGNAPERVRLVRIPVIAGQGGVQ